MPKTTPRVIAEPSVSPHPYQTRSRDGAASKPEPAKDDAFDAPTRSISQVFTPDATGLLPARATTPTTANVSALARKAFRPLVLARLMGTLPDTKPSLMIPVRHINN